MSQLKFLNKLFCDHASVGAGNKMTLLNVYSGDQILIPSVPTNIALATYLEMVAPCSGSLRIKFSFRLNSQMVGQLEAQAGDMIKGAIGILMLPAFPIGITAGGDFRLIAEADGYARTTVIAKKIVVSPVTDSTIA